MMHRRCTRPRHHVWTYRQTIAGWALAVCAMCGRDELA